MKITSAIVISVIVSAIISIIITVVALGGSVSVIITSITAIIWPIGVATARSAILVCIGSRCIRGFIWAVINIFAFDIRINIFTFNRLRASMFGQLMFCFFMFALALSVGLTPQMLPAIISVNLSQGAKRMSEQGVIVKKLNAIEAFSNKHKSRMCSICNYTDNLFA